MLQSVVGQWVRDEVGGRYLVPSQSVETLTERVSTSSTYTSWSTHPSLAAARGEKTQRTHPSLYLEVFHITWFSWPLNQISHMWYSKCKWAGKLLSSLSFWRRTFLPCCPISWRVIVCSNRLWYFGVLVVTSLSDFIIWDFSLLPFTHLAKIYLFCLSFKKASS